MIRATVKVSDSGKSAWEEFTKRMQQLHGSYVTVGVHEGAGEYDSGVSVVQVALWNEFGVKSEHVTIPERSFIRSAIDENASLINAWRVELVEKVVHDGWTVEKALTALGFRCQVLVQNKIKSDIPPENAPRTIAAKEKAGVPQQTLQFSKLMLRSITFQVHVND